MNEPLRLSDLEIRDLFCEAREVIQPDQRLAFLKSRCRGDEASLNRILGLLDSLEESEDTEGLSVGLPSLSEDEDVGVSSLVHNQLLGLLETDLGAYQVLERIGEGSTSQVYLAQQHSPLERKVAIKVIKPGMESAEILHRFALERKALEVLSHPSIAKLLDAGVTPMGRSYIVIELIDGEPLTSYCRHRCLALAERLALFRQVCDAVRYAHQRGILHRDLKPKNILVTEFNGAGHPFVIDFGLAKSFSSSAVSMQTCTRHGQLLGTLEYMSPEQSTLGSVAVDVRSDVYSLVSVLYEMIVGRSPLSTALSRTEFLDESLRMIREVYPVAPRFETLNERGSVVSTPIHKDLEAIVFKGLEKDPAKRYSSVYELDEDLKRYERQELVHARPVTKLYRFQRILLRHRWLATTCVVVVASLIVGLGTAIWGWRAAVNGQQEAKHGESLAVASQLATENNLSFLKTALDIAFLDGRTSEQQLKELWQSYVSYIDPKQMESMDSPYVQTVSKIAQHSRTSSNLGIGIEGLRALYEKMKRELPQDHQVLSLVAFELARTYEHRGDIEGSNAAKELLNSLTNLPPEMEQKIQFLKASILTREDRWQEAYDVLQPLEKDLSMRKFEGELLCLMGRMDEGLAVLRDVLDKARQGDDRKLECTVLKDLASSLRFEHHYDEADRLALEAHEKARILFGEFQFITLASQGVRLEIAMSQGDYLRARDIGSALLKRAQDAPAHSVAKTRIGVIEIMLGWCSVELGDFEDAEKRLTPHLQTKDLDHGMSGMLYSSLSRCSQHLGDHQRAKAFADEALKHIRKEIECAPPYYRERAREFHQSLVQAGCIP